MSEQAPFTQLETGESAGRGNVWRSCEKVICFDFGLMGIYRSRLILCVACLQIGCSRLGFEPPGPVVSVELSVVGANPTNQSPILLQADFSADVVDFSTSALSLDAGRLEQAQSLSPRTYRVSLVPSASQRISVWVEQNTVHDRKGRGNRASPRLEVYYDTEPPVLTSMVINNGADYAPSSFVTVRVSATDLCRELGLLVRLAEAGTGGDCQTQYADDNWREYSDASWDFSFLLSAGDGTKKVCGWARDPAGNTSLVDPPLGTPGVDFDTIDKELANIPQILAFEVTNGNSAAAGYHTRSVAVGDALEISWTVVDAEGLSNGPIELEYTTDDETWSPVVSGYGGLTDNPTTYADVYTGFVSPVDTYLRLRLTAKDRAGNTSVRALSDLLNSGPWSVYAGNNDSGIGTTGCSARISADSRYGARFAVHPTTNDIIATYEGVGTVRFSASSGQVSLFAEYSSICNLPDSGPLPQQPAFYTYYSYYAFDPGGRLYVVTYLNGADPVAKSGAVYQIDLSAHTVRRYLGGGEEHDATASPFEISAIPGPLAFDEDGSLYFFSACTPNASTSENPVFRLMKSAQYPDGTAGPFSVVAGDCSNGSPNSGELATQSPFPSPAYKGFLPEIAVWDRGEVIYVASSPMWKILNGRVYQVERILEDCETLAYEPFSARLLAADVFVASFAPGLLGDGGEVLERMIATDTGVGSCVADGTPSQNACVSVGGVRVSGQGIAVFTDGPLNSRIRYVDSDDRVQTALGTLPFYGDGLNKRLLRGQIAGIYYKNALEPNLASFPAGLYFVSPTGVLFGHVDPNTGVTSVLWGNQQNRPSGILFTGGEVIGPEVSLGREDKDGNLTALGFEDGLPYLRYNDRLVKLDSSGHVVALQIGWTMWDDFTGTDPAATYMNAYGTRHNMTIEQGGIFLLGGGTWPSPSDQGQSAVLRFFDFVTPNVVHIMGNSGPPAYSPDTNVSQDVDDLSFHSSCINWEQAGYNVYRADDDRLYFSEADKIRFVEHPLDPAHRALGTLFTGVAGHLQDFTFSPSGDKVFYLVQYSGLLYCYNISSTDTWCDNATLLAPPEDLQTFGRGPNHFTWVNERTLLITAYYQGTVLQFDLDAMP